MDPGQLLTLREYNLAYLSGFDTYPDPDVKIIGIRIRKTKLYKNPDQDWTQIGFLEQSFFIKAPDCTRTRMADLYGSRPRLYPDPDPPWKSCSP